jgi:hypothetical protein
MPTKHGLSALRAIPAALQWHATVAVSNPRAHGMHLRPGRWPAPLDLLRRSPLRVTGCQIAQVPGGRVDRQRALSGLRHQAPLAPPATWVPGQLRVGPALRELRFLDTRSCESDSGVAATYYRDTDSPAHAIDVSKPFESPRHSDVKSFFSYKEVVTVLEWSGKGNPSYAQGCESPGLH